MEANESKKKDYLLEGTGEVEEGATTKKTDRKWIHDDDVDDDEADDEEEFDDGDGDGEDEVWLRRSPLIKGCFCWVSI